MQAGTVVTTPTDPSTSAHDDRPGSAGGAPTILVVEDEDALRRLVVRMLRRMGYETLEAAHGVDGMAVAREAADSLDLILSDVVMPRLNGPDMAAELQRAGIGTPVAYMSGYSGRELAGADLHTHFLAKPFTMDELEAFVATVLASD